jgi:molybdate transport system ATP-binding protein
MKLEADLHGRAGDLRVHLQLSVERGPVVLAGPNGAGKTSSLHLLLGLLQPERGRLVLDGRTLFDADGGIDVPPEERNLGYVPQDYALFPHLNVLENVRFGLEPRLRRADADLRARHTLDELGGLHLEARRTGSLSGGERQLVALARALATEPQALLLDEPLAALDAGARQKVRTFLATRLAALRIPAVVVTHDPGDAAALAQRVAVLEQGRVVQVGTLAELRREPATAFVAQFALPA